MKHAVISNPRTGSRELALQLSRDNVEIGYLHFAKSVPSNCLSYEELISCNGVIHGHWHTIDYLSNQHKLYIKKNYKIHHIVRNHEHRFASSIIVMHLGNINFKRNQIPKFISKEHVYKYINRMRPAYNSYLNWKIDYLHCFDDLYNNSSEANFQSNTIGIENYSELSELYYTLIKKENYQWIF